MKKLLFLFLIPFLAFGQTDPGFGKFRNVAVSSTDVSIKPSQCAVYGYTFINYNTTAVYVKFYNGTTANVVVGTTTPQCMIMVPPGDGTTPGIVYLAADTVSYQYFQLACSIAVVTGSADNSTAAPGTPIYIEVLYK